MNYGLGIDTGGTYTDAVIYDYETETIIESAKTLTTHDDLTRCVTEVIRRFTRASLARVRLVALSTTLATNACIEGRGADARLVITGGDKKIISARHSEFGLPPAEEIIFIGGRISLDGAITEEPDWDEVRAVLAEAALTDRSFAVAGMLASRNPALEYRIGEILTGLGCEVVCSCDLAINELNYLRRASSALLNARLTPLISAFIASVKTSLNELDIKAPVYIVRSDGSLMSAGFAERRPIETLLSGPTASVAGAARLTGEGDAIVADIGGTTCDLALIRGGIPVINENGVSLGNWQTTVCATYIETFGLGGDSRISVQRDGKLTLGPERVEPLCILARDFPSVTEELRRMKTSRYQGQPRRYEFFRLVRSAENIPNLSPYEKDICRLLSGGPMAADMLAEAAGTDVYTFRTETLEKRGIIIRSGFTPTDAMHMAGIYTAYNTDASRLGAAYFTRLLSVSEGELCDLIFDRIRLTLYSGIIRLLTRYIRDAGLAESEELAALAEEAWYEKRDTIFSNRFCTSAALIGVGAPTHVFIGEVADRLGTRSRVPDNAAVANAVGAAVSGVSVRREVEIRPSYTTGGLEGYYILSLADNPFYDSYEAALDRAKTEAVSSARAEAARRGLIGETEANIDIRRNDSIASLEDGIIDIELGIYVSATVRGSVDKF
ncbi:MAG: hydantoinase/oxoprolinase family protein [Eubacteriales bacterium]|nr:hydantoinase/oxoprolinase family protein [Eubacteriales bacterium]